MKKLIYVVGMLLLVCGAAFSAGGKWSADYPRFHDRDVCPDTKFVGQVTCDGVPVEGVPIQIENFGAFGDWLWVYSDADGNYDSGPVPLGYYRIYTFGEFPRFYPVAYFIHAKWRCGVIPFYFEVCP